MKKFARIYNNELKACFSDLGVIVFFLLVPIGYPLLYAYIYSGEVVREISVAAVDLSNSSESRKFLQKADATPQINIAQHCTDMLQARELMAQNKVKGIIFVPQEFSKNLHTETQANISIYCNMSSLFYYKAILVACTEVSLALNKDIQIKQLAGLTPSQAKSATTPLAFKAIGLSNSSEGFANFLIPAILILVIQQTLLLGIGVRMGTEQEKARKEIVLSASTLAARSAAYITLYIPVSAYLLCIVPKIFSLYSLAQPLTLSAFILPYLIGCTLLAIAIGQHIKGRETAMLLYVFTSIPLLFLSGISWPGSSVPAFLKALSYLVPSTPAINGFVRINGSGATLQDVSLEYTILWIQAIVYFLIIRLYETKKTKKRATR